jgi:hypothetical protein
MEKEKLEVFNRLARSVNVVRNVFFIALYVSAAIVGVSIAVWVSSGVVKEICK